MAVRKITKREVDQLGKGELIWDIEVKGLGVRCQTTDAKYFMLRYPIAARGNTRQRIMSIGRYGSPWTPEQARTEAKKLLGQVASGRDPLAEREAKREERKRPKLSLTFAEAVEDYIAAKFSGWKPGT